MARIAIIGTGISGLGAAYLLHRRHDITIYEKAKRIGGHTRTVTVDYGGKAVPVDTGFIVYNEANYPHLSGMFAHLGVAVHASDMSFAASIRDGWLEWGAKDLGAVFAQKRNLVRPQFARMARDVFRFNARAVELVARRPELTLGGMIAALGLGDWFARFYLLPMCGAIWSCPPRTMLDFPASSLVRFMANHRLLSAGGQPQWYTVTGGSQEYVRRLTAPFADRIRIGCGPVRVERDARGVTVTSTDGARQTFDHIVFASHGDETLQLLSDADAEERAALSAFRYQPNIAVLHRDPSQMPKRRRCWSSWNYLSDGDIEEPALSVTYWMNRLQAIPNDTPLFVTLNPKRSIAPQMIFDVHEFAHPVFDAASIAAQTAVQQMQGRRNTWFCGAYLRNGFHEDGLASAVHVARLLGTETPWQAPRPDFPEPLAWPIPHIEQAA